MSSSDSDSDEEVCNTYMDRGDILNDYTVQEQIGQGTCSEIHLLTKGSETFVLKEVQLDKYNIYGIGNPQEIDILSRLRHPNLIHAVEIFTPIKGKDLNGVALVLPVFHHDLREIMYNPKYTIENKLKNIFQVICAVQYLHSNNVLHLDVKSPNILVNVMAKDEFEDITTEAVLTDFGISAHSVNGTAVLNMEVITPLYRAPESWKLNYTNIDNTYTTKDDMWSLGITMLECFSDEKLLKIVRGCVYPFVTRRCSYNIKDLKELELFVFRLTELRSLGVGILDLEEGDVRDNLVLVLNGLLDPNPVTRWSCDQLIKCSLFSNFVVPVGNVVEAQVVPITCNLIRRISQLLDKVVTFFNNSSFVAQRVETFFLTVDLLYRCGDVVVVVGDEEEEKEEEEEEKEEKKKENEEEEEEKEEEKEELEDTVLLYSCIMLAQSLIATNVKEISIAKQEINEVLGYVKIGEEAIAFTQSRIVQKLNGVLYRDYIYKDCETLEQLKWCYLNLLGDLDEYVNYKCGDIPEIGGCHVKSTCSKFVEMVGM